jgi:hypothetical protein
MNRRGTTKYLLGDGGKVRKLKEYCQNHCIPCSASISEGWMKVETVMEWIEQVDAEVDRMFLA